MKKVISFILAVICIVPVGSINASAEELTMELKDSVFILLAGGHRCGRKKVILSVR